MYSSLDIAFFLISTFHKSNDSKCNFLLKTEKTSRSSFDFVRAHGGVKQQSSLARSVCVDSFWIRVDHILWMKTKVRKNAKKCSEAQKTHRMWPQRPSGGHRGAAFNLQGHCWGRLPSSGLHLRTKRREAFCIYWGKDESSLLRMGSCQVFCPLFRAHLHNIWVAFSRGSSKLYGFPLASKCSWRMITAVMPSASPMEGMDLDLAKFVSNNGWMWSIMISTAFDMCPFNWHVSCEK